MSRFPCQAASTTLSSRLDTSQPHLHALHLHSLHRSTANTSKWRPLSHHLPLLARKSNASRNFASISCAAHVPSTQLWCTHSTTSVPKSLLAQCPLPRPLNVSSTAPPLTQTCTSHVVQATWCLNALATQTALLHPQLAAVLVATSALATIASTHKRSTPQSWSSPLRSKWQQALQLKLKLQLCVTALKNLSPSAPPASNSDTSNLQLASWCALTTAQLTASWTAPFSKNRSKAINMRFHWLQDRVSQKMFKVRWAPGKVNLANHFTKHHLPKHVKQLRPLHTTQSASLQDMQGCVELLAAPAAWVQSWHLCWPKARQESCLSWRDKVCVLSNTHTFQHQCLQSISTSCHIINASVMWPTPSNPRKRARAHDF